MKSEHTRLLVVEDESHLAAGLKLNFELEGFAVDVAETAREATQHLVGLQAYAAIILDVMLPDIDGFELCRKLRSSGNYTPVIMLTARNSPHDRVKGLEAGADDYLAKPFEFSELLARIQSMIRRQQWESDESRDSRSSTKLYIGKAKVNVDAQQAFVGDRAIPLTQLELDLIKYFVEHPDRVLSREELLENVWQLRNYPNTRTVDNFVLRLRKYFEPDPARPVHFLSVRGSGYRFCPAPD